MDVQERIKRQVGENSVLLYMKGTPDFPQCGFSAAVVQVLTHLGVKFKGINVLEDAELRRRLGSQALVDARAYELDEVGGQWERLFADATAKRAANVTGRS